MLPGVTIPASLAGLLLVFEGCLTAPGFVTFAAMVQGSIAATGRRTVCGMLVSAGLSRVWPHDRAHYFFARARWDAIELGLVLARLVLDMLVPAGTALSVAVDDTLFKRSGPQVFGRFWQHDGAGRGRRSVAPGVCFVVVGIVVDLPFCAHPVCLPVLARLWLPAPKPTAGSRPGRKPARRSATAATAIAVQRAQARLDHAVGKRDARQAKQATRPGRLPGSVPDLEGPIAQATQALADAKATHAAALATAAHSGPGRGRRAPRTATTAVTDAYPTKTEIACDLIRRLAAAFPDRDIHTVADAAYHSPALRDLPASVTWTFRLAKTAVLHPPPPPPTGRPGRPPTKGTRLGTPADIAATLTFTRTRLHHATTNHTATTAYTHCLWYHCLGPARLRLILVRNPATTSGYDLALLTTDPTSSPTALITRYAARWSIEVCFHDARQHLGTGQPHNRTRTAVERTIPFQLAVYSLVIIWYTHTGHHPNDVATRRTTAPWYTTKTDPAFEDMIVKLRRVIIATQFLPTHPDQATPQQIRDVHLAWAAAIG
jgi:hypothetical protein